MRILSSFMFAACVAAFGCGTTPSTQTVTGTTTDAIAVRAVSGSSVVTAAQVQSDGSFSLSLPAGAAYRLELLTSSGVEPVLEDTGSTYADLEVHVCHPGKPLNVGAIGPHHHGDGSGDGDGDGGSGGGGPGGGGSGDMGSGGCIGMGSGGPGGGHGGPGGGPGGGPSGGPGGPGGGPGGSGGGSDACDADPMTCGCSGGSACWPPPFPPDCGSDGSDCVPPGGGDGMCPANPPPNEIGC